jgi:hypothetical protein
MIGDVGRLGWGATMRDKAWMKRLAAWTRCVPRRVWWIAIALETAAALVLGWRFAEQLNALSGLAGWFSGFGALVAAATAACMVWWQNSEQQKAQDQRRLETTQVLAAIYSPLLDLLIEDTDSRHRELQRISDHKDVDFYKILRSGKYKPQIPIPPALREAIPHIMTMLPVTAARIGRVIVEFDNYNRVVERWSSQDFVMYGDNLVEALRQHLEVLAALRIHLEHVSAPLKVEDFQYG